VGIFPVVLPAARDLEEEEVSSFLNSADESKVGRRRRQGGERGQEIIIGVLLL